MLEASLMEDINMNRYEKQREIDTIKENMVSHSYLYQQMFVNILGFDQGIQSLNQFFGTNILEYVKPEKKLLNKVLKTARKPIKIDYLLTEKRVRSQLRNQKREEREQFDPYQIS